jgi:TRAP-type C4-dicarboxylate transport system substrate-binding protein
MAPKLSRRSLIAAATAVGSTIIVKSTRAADYTFEQYHNQPASGTLHKNLTAMWDAIANETNGRVEGIVHSENNKIAGGDPEAFKKLLAGEIQFFTLMGGIIGTVVPVAEACTCSRLPASTTACDRSPPSTARSRSPTILPA